MTGETVGGQQTLADSKVYSLLCPDYAYRGFGQADSLSGYLYEPIKEQGSADRMLAFIDQAAKVIDTSEPDGELNQDKIHRLVWLVADIPDEIDEDERLRAWGHLLEADWVHLYARAGNIDEVIDHLADHDRTFAQAIYNQMVHVYTRKHIHFKQTVGFSDDIPFISRKEFDQDKAFKGLDAVTERHPDSLPEYNSIVVLAMSLSSQQLVPN